MHTGRSYPYQRTASTVVTGSIQNQLLVWTKVLHLAVNHKYTTHWCAQDVFHRPLQGNMSDLINPTYVRVNELLWIKPLAAQVNAAVMIHLWHEYKLLISYSALHLSQEYSCVCGILLGTYILLENEQFALCKEN